MTARQALKVDASLGRSGRCLSLDSPWVRSRRDSNDEEERPSGHSGTTTLEETLDTSHDGDLHTSLNDAEEKNKLRKFKLIMYSYWERRPHLAWGIG